MSVDANQIEFLLDPTVTDCLVQFDEESCVALGKSLHDEYVNNSPFPHIVMENFLPLPLLRLVVEEFPQRETGKFNDAHSRLKTGYQREKIASPLINCLINGLNSASFLRFLEEMTGIDGLIPDPYQLGGGLHETARGGHLSIHADFNTHKKLGLRRRMNLILFLNEDWNSAFGGALELWKTDMSVCEKAVLPEIGRAVVFNTTSDSFHGHPDPLQVPDGRYRRSLALYYYSVPTEEERLESSHSTDFRARPGSEDKKQSGLSKRRLAQEFLPPVIYRMLKKH